MRYLLALCTLLLALSCTTTDPVQPSSTLVTHYQVGKKLHLQIHSTAPSATICHESGRCLVVVSHYYTCISTSVDPGETITVSDGVEEAIIITDPIQHP